MIKSFSFWSLNLLCKVIDLMKPIFTYGFTSACFGNIGSLGNWNQCLWNFFCNQQKIPKGWSPLSDHAKIPISTKVIRIHLSLFWLLGITWETGPTFTKAKGNLNLLPAYAPHGPIPPPLPFKVWGGKNTSPAVHGALPCSMQLSHKLCVEEVNNADGSIPWVAAGCFFLLQILVMRYDFWDASNL